MQRRNSRSCHSSAQNPREFRTQSIPASLRCAWQGPDHNLRTRGEIRDRRKGHCLETPSNKVAIHRHAYRFSDDEAKPRGQARVTKTEIDQGETGSHSPTSPHKASIVVSPDKPVGFGQHRV